jgi:hypothetical protein
MGWHPGGLSTWFAPPLPSCPRAGGRLQRIRASRAAASRNRIALCRRQQPRCRGGHNWQGEPREETWRRAPCACDRHATPGVRVPYLCASAGGCAPPTCGGSSPRAGGWRNKPRTAPEQTARGAGQPVHWTGGRIVHWTVCDDDVASPAAERRRTLPTSPPVRAPSPLGKPANFSQQTWLRAWSRSVL